MSKPNKFQTSIDKQMQEFNVFIEKINKDGQEADAIVTLDAFIQRNFVGALHFMSDAITANKIPLNKLYDPNGQSVMPKIPYVYDGHSDVESFLDDLKRNLDDMVSDVFDAIISNTLSTGKAVFENSDFNDVPSLLWYFVMSVQGSKELNESMCAFINEKIREVNADTTTGLYIPLLKHRTDEEDWSNKIGYTRHETFRNLLMRIWKSKDSNDVQLAEDMFVQDRDLHTILDLLVDQRSEVATMMTSIENANLAPTIAEHIDNAKREALGMANVYFEALMENQVEHLPKQMSPEIRYQLMQLINRDKRNFDVLKANKEAHAWIGHLLPRVQTQLEIHQESEEKTKEYSTISDDTKGKLEKFKYHWKLDPGGKFAADTLFDILANNSAVYLGPSQFVQQMDALIPHLSAVVKELEIPPVAYVNFLTMLAEPVREQLEECDENQVTRMLYGALDALTDKWDRMPDFVDQPKKFIRALISFIVSVPAHQNHVLRLMEMCILDPRYADMTLKMINSKMFYCAPVMSTIRIPTNYMNKGAFNIQSFFIEYIEDRHEFNKLFVELTISDYPLLFPHIVVGDASKALLDSYSFARQYHDIL